MGFSVYVLKLAIFQCLVSLAWLWWRSDHSARCQEAWGTLPEIRRRWLWALACTGAAALTAAPVVYRFLTRRESYVASGWEVTLSLLCAALLAAAALFCIAGLRSIRAIRAREAAPVALCMGLLVAVPLPAALWFKAVEAPRLQEQGLEVYGEKAYSWKHYHEWPQQGRILLEGVIPAVAFGRWTEMEGDPQARWPWSWKGAASVCILGLLSLGLWRHTQSRGLSRTFSERDVVIVGPFFLTILVILPSWSLFSDFSYRYLLPFLPGLFLFAYRCWELPIQRHRRVGIALLVAYLLYCGTDVWRLVGQPTW
jgi:hypothetical protein